MNWFDDSRCLSAIRPSACRKQKRLARICKPNKGIGRCILRRGAWRVQRRLLGPHFVEVGSAKLACNQRLEWRCNLHRGSVTPSCHGPAPHLTALKLAPLNCFEEVVLLQRRSTPWLTAQPLRLAGRVRPGG